MKRENIIFVLTIIIFCFLLFFGFFIAVMFECNGTFDNCTVKIPSLKTSQSTDIEYQFENDNYYNSTELDVHSSYNVRDKLEYNGNYYANYSFENDVGSYEPNEWVDLSDGTSYCQVLDNINGHDSVLMLNDTQNTSKAKIITYVDDWDYATIEFWISITDNTKTYYNLIAYHEGTVAINTLIVSGEFKGYWASSFHTTGISVSNDVWYHSKIIFNCTTDTYDWYIDGILGLDDATFQNSVNHIDNFGYSTDTSATSYEYYIDAVGLDIGNHYEATHSFQNEIGLIDNNIDFIDFNTGNDAYHNATVIPYYLDHHSVIDFKASGNNGKYWYWKSAYYNYYGNVDFEYWLLYKDNGVGYHNIYVYGMNNTNQLIFYSLFRSDLNQITTIYGNGAGGTSSYSYSASPNVWHHVKYSVDFTTDTFSVILNNIEILSDKPFYNDRKDNGLYYYKFQLDTGGGLNQLEMFIDAIGESWDADYSVSDNLIPYWYNVGDNLVSLSDDLGLIESDKWMFDFSEVGVSYVVGTDVFDDWDEIDDGDDWVNIASHPNYTSRRRIQLEHYAPDTANRGIERNFNINYGILNISWIWNITNMGGTTTEFTTCIYSSDATKIVHIQIENGVLEYDDGSEHTLDSGLVINVNYEFNCYVNYNDEIVILEYYANGVYQDKFFVPILVMGKDGLSKIELFIDTTVTNDCLAYIDYVGVYVNNTSICNQFGYIENEPLLYPSNPVYWFTNWNLFNCSVNGNYSLYFCEYPYLPIITTLQLIVPLDVYDNGIFRNLYYDTYDGESFMSEVEFFFLIYDDFEVNYLSLDACKMIEGTNEYYLQLQSNVNINESYFYVYDNKLYFTLTASNSSLEYILATFNINDVELYSKAFVYSSYRSGLFFSEIRLYHVGTTATIIDVPIGLRTQRVYLPSEKALDYISILITDDDYYNTTTTTGYFGTFILRVSTEHDIEITTTNLFDAILPLLFLIMIPSLVVVYALKKGSIEETTRENMLIPFMAIFSFIAYMLSELELWSLFLMVIGFITIYIIKKGES